MRVSHENRENFHVSRTSQKLIVEVLNLFIFFAIFSQISCAGLSRIFRATFVRVSRTCPREILANLQCEIFATLVQCNASVVRRSRDCRTNENENKLNSLESRETFSRMSRDCRAIVARCIFKIRPKFANLSHKCPFNETTT